MAAILESNKKKSEQTSSLPRHSDLAFPETRYCKTRQELDHVVGRDFIKHANRHTSSGDKFIVGLVHGQSPSGAYRYILEHFFEINCPELLRFTFVNSPLRRQRDLVDVLDAGAFLKELIKRGHINRDQVLGSNLKRESMDQFCSEFNARFTNYLKEHKKAGLDYAFLSTNSEGHVGGISRNSEAFDSEDIAVVVVDRRQDKEMTATPNFLQKTRRIAFLATKADKRRALAFLLAHWGRPNESPSFLRFMPEVSKRMTVFVDNEALTWPLIAVDRETPYGTTKVKVDLPYPYEQWEGTDLPVVVMIHGFLGLNSFDGLMTSLPTHKYIPAAMHYGSIPNDLPPAEYSRHIVKNIDAVVTWFGEKGHPVFLFDHSMGNIYFQIIDKEFYNLGGVKKYLKGRIGANPFFGEEAKHALLGFMDSVIIPSLSLGRNTVEKTMFMTMRRIVPFDTKKGVRRRGINLAQWLISKDTGIRDRVWAAVKARILYLMTTIGSLPPIYRIPIEKALNRLPAKVFALQIHSALQESKAFDRNTGLKNMESQNIPVLILKSRRDVVAKYVSRVYSNSPQTEVVDVTRRHEKDLFREHLFHMVEPLRTTELIDDFITKVLNHRG